MLNIIIIFVEYEVEYFRLANTFQLKIDRLVKVLKTNYDSSKEFLQLHCLFFLCIRGLTKANN